jgi:prepilin-type processing-associated H-X9-DG protein
MPIPLDPRRKPASVKIHVKSGAGVDIAWADGHASHFDFPYLREQCPCATCNDERGKKEEFTSAIAGSTASSAALPMFKPKPRAQAATQVGNYAIQITFSDGHATGIYSYDHLRTLCPCQECAKAFRPEINSPR